METIALVVAAGEGTRLGGDMPKQYQPLAGRPMLAHAMQSLAAHPGVSAVRAVINTHHRHFYDRLDLSGNFLSPTQGGATRQDSVRLGLESLEKDGHAPRQILIHDGARPFISTDLISRLLARLADSEAVVPLLPIRDTLKKASDGTITDTFPRDNLYYAQTPQAFHFNSLLAAHRRLTGQTLTDDAAIAEAAGITVSSVPGEERAFKITSPEDMDRAHAFLTANYETRVGTGFDVHRLQPFDKATPASHRVVMLCGVPVPHDSRLEGHSDADTGLHALVDALLGAMGEGDIGMHFSPTDPRWRGADSAHFVMHALHLLKQRGGRILNADITLMCERPRLAPHRAAMIARMAGLLDISYDRVNLKATTTERMGFIGRGEGIAAQAVVTIKLPAKP